MKSLGVVDILDEGADATARVTLGFKMPGPVGPQCP